MNKMNVFKGLNGTIVLHEEYVSIVRNSMIDATFHEVGEMKIPYKRIKKIEVVPGGLTNGYITLMEDTSVFPSTVFMALKNKNSVIFRMTKNSGAEKIKNMICEKCKE